jgi:SAM-dependent methyltransferase
MTGTDDDGSAMVAEFDVLAEWTAQAVLELGPDHAIPAGCRGSASPVELAWLGEACELEAGSVLLDVGGGVGGPAAFAAERFGVRPVIVEPMAGACRAGERLFAIPTLVGTGERLPIETQSVDFVWCLGVICTTAQKAELLAELRRVLRPGGRLGLLVLVADEPHPAGAPEGNSFPGAEELTELLDQADFKVLERRRTRDFAEAPLSWTERLERIDAAVERSHADDPRLGVIKDQERRMGDLLSSGTVESIVLHAVAR